MKINYLSILFISIFLVISCSKKESGTLSDTKTEREIGITSDSENGEAGESEDYLLMEVTKVGIPNFDISLIFSEEAFKKLRDADESVIASLAFTSDNYDSSELPASLKKFDQMNGLNLGVFEFESSEITNPMIIHPEGMSFSKELYEVLTNKDINLNINVFSGRKSSKDNLILSEIYDGKFSEILENGPLELNVKLIDED